MTPLDTGLPPPASRLAVAFDGAPGASRHRLSARRLTTAVTALEVTGTSTRLTSGARGES